MKRFLKKKKSGLLMFLGLTLASLIMISSSHREAPLIADDPLADNTDVYAFRDPYHTSKIIIIANYIPSQLPAAGPNYYHFGENIRYEIHIKNNSKTEGDDITYRFTFKKVNEDPTTFFDIRLGKENSKTTFKLEKKVAAEGNNWETVIDNGIVPPPNIGPRSITMPVGLNAPSYASLMQKAIKNATTGEKVFVGTVDDPFFVDLGGIFDLGDAPRTTGTRSEDFLKCKNVSTIAMQIDIKDLQKDHKKAGEAHGILDPDYVIGVWASASRQRIKVLNVHHGGEESFFGDWVQVSRLGMPLTNEAVIPIGYKDYWNSLTPYQDLSKLNVFGNFFYNPELALYMDDAQFGKAIPALTPLRIQKNSLGHFGFGNGQNGLFGLPDNALAGTALGIPAFKPLLLPGPGKPRSVDLYPIFNTGVPNLPPYQLAIQKGGNPLAPGKPFINNFLPTGGDMLRLNMAVPPTDRKSSDFSPLGLVQAAALGLTDPRFNKTKELQVIPNMDGFPNGRRLEDDVTRIELQAVSGIVLAVLGLWYDDFQPGQSPLTPNLLSVYTYSTGIDKNDTSFAETFPYEQGPWSGSTNCPCDFDQKMPASNIQTYTETSSMGLAAPELFATATPNPMISSSVIKYRLEKEGTIKIAVFDAEGRPVKVLMNQNQKPGTYTLNWQAPEISKGSYFIQFSVDGQVRNSMKIIKQ